MNFQPPKEDDQRQQQADAITPPLKDDLVKLAKECGAEAASLYIDGEEFANELIINRDELAAFAARASAPPAQAQIEIDAERTKNLQVAELILANDRAGAVQWAKDLLYSVHAGVRLDDQAQGEPLTDSYVQTVPDKCDRIVWRNRYYHLPELTPPETAVQAVPSDAQIEREAFLIFGKYAIEARSLFRSFARAVLALAVPQAPLQAEPVPVVASEPSGYLIFQGDKSVFFPTMSQMVAGTMHWYTPVSRVVPLYATPQAEPAVAEQARGIMTDYQPLYDFALKHRVSFNELCAAVRSSLAPALASQSTPPPVKGGKA